MKIIHKYVLFSTILSLLTAGVYGQTTQMSSNPLKKNEIVLYGSYQFYETAKKYDWNNDRWNPLADSLKQTFQKLLPMAGYGITDKLSVYIQFPVSYFDQINGKAPYFDDILLMGRYAVTPSSGSRSGLTLIGAARLPTGKTGQKNYSDGSFDLTAGEIYSTKWYGNWRTHIKSDFTLNMKNVDDINPGNEFNLVMKQDYRIGDVTLMLNNKLSHQSGNKDSNGDEIDNTVKTRIYHTFFVQYRFRNDMQIRSGLQMTSYAIGGSDSGYKILLETIYKFQWPRHEEK